MWTINWRVIPFIIVPFLIIGIVFLGLGITARPDAKTDDGYPWD